MVQIHVLEDPLEVQHDLSNLELFSPSIGTLEKIKTNI